jgi:hypothetical protein
MSVILLDKFGAAIETSPQPPQAFRDSARLIERIRNAAANHSLCVNVHQV